MLERYNGIEPDPEGAFVYYEQAYQAVERLEQQVAQLRSDLEHALKECDQLRQSFATTDYKLAHARIAHAEDVASCEQEIDRLHTAHATLRGLVARLVNDLPTKRDWLDPDLERLLRAATLPREGGAQS